jgi:hypothetical protein
LGRRERLTGEKKQKSVAMNPRDQVVEPSFSRSLPWSGKDAAS